MMPAKAKHQLVQVPISCPKCEKGCGLLPVHIVNGRMAMLVPKKKKCRRCDVEFIVGADDSTATEPT